MGTKSSFLSLVTDMSVVGLLLIITPKHTENVTLKLIFYPVPSAFVPIICVLRSSVVMIQ